VFLKLLKDQTSPEERRAIFRPKRHPQPKKQARKPVEPLSAAEVEHFSTQALAETGEAPTVKMTLIGRPGRVIEKGNVVLTSLPSRKPPSLPKGLPQPPGKPTTYVVYIALKQWRKVRDALKDPADCLIIEGYPLGRR
jgi:hypothetical protein